MWQFQRDFISDSSFIRTQNPKYEFISVFCEILYITWPQETLLRDLTVTFFPEHNCTWAICNDEWFIVQSMLSSKINRSLLFDFIFTIMQSRSCICWWYIVQETHIEFEFSFSFPFEKRKRFLLWKLYEKYKGFLQSPNMYAKSRQVRNIHNIASMFWKNRKFDILLYKSKVWVV